MAAGLVCIEISECVTRWLHRSPEGWLASSAFTDTLQTEDTLWSEPFVLGNKRKVALTLSRRGVG